MGTIQEAAGGIMVGDTKKSIENREKKEEWKTTFEKSRIVSLAEQIYTRKGKIRKLQFELESEEYHFKYILVRVRSTTEHIAINSVYCILFLCGWIALIICIAMGAFIRETETFVSIVVLSAIMVILTISGGGMTFMGWIRNISLMWNSRPTKKAREIAKKRDVKSYDVEYQTSKKKIEYLREEISHLNQEISGLQSEWDNYVSDLKNNIWDGKQKEKEEDTASPTESKKKGLGLKVDSESNNDRLLLYNFYANQIKNDRDYQESIKVRIDSVNREIVDRKEKYDTAIHYLKMFMIVYVFLAILQSFLYGAMANIIASVCVIAAIIAIFLLNRICTKPIYLYWIEEEKPIMQEYAFKNGIIPLKYKRQDLIKEMESYEDEIKTLRELMKKLEID